MSLEKFVDNYCVLRDASKGYRYQIGVFLGLLGQCRKEPLEVCDLGNAEIINEHLACCKERGLSKATRKNRRRMWLTLAREAHRQGLCGPIDSLAVAQIRGKETIHKGFSVEQIRQLLATAEKRRGVYSTGIPKKLWWPAYIRTCWDSGLRGCDVRQLEKSDWQTDEKGTARLTIVQEKTGKVHRIFLRASTVSAIEKIVQPERRCIFGLWCRINYWRQEARRLMNAAGLPGSIGQLRHSSGTNVEGENPGWGHRHLGNTPEVFEKNYKCHDLLPIDRPLPVEL